MMSHKIGRDGSICWYNSDGELHRDGDKPAEIWCDGSQLWSQSGVFHRENDLPAIIWFDGQREWYQNGKRHRDNKPALIRADGMVEYWVRGAEIK